MISQKSELQEKCANTSLPQLMLPRIIPKTHCKLPNQNMADSCPHRLSSTYLAENSYIV